MTVVVAPKARDMKARGKREAKRSASPLVRRSKKISSPEGASYGAYFGPSGLNPSFGDLNQGRRASRLPLAVICRALGAHLRLRCYGLEANLK